MVFVHLGIELGKHGGREEEIDIQSTHKIVLYEDIVLYSQPRYQNRLLFRHDLFQ